MTDAPDLLQKQRELEERRRQQPGFVSLADRLNHVAAAKESLEKIAGKFDERWEEHVRKTVREAQNPIVLDRQLAQAGVRKRFRVFAPTLSLVPAPVREWVAEAREGPVEAWGSAILCGPRGSGKTFAAVWVLRTIYLSGAVDESGDYDYPSFRFLDAADLVDLFYPGRESKGGSGLLDQARYVQVLVIDDWGAAYEHDWSRAAFDRLITNRCGDLKTTIITTNLPPEDSDPKADTFSARYPRAFSRLCEDGPGVILMNRGDLRRSGK